LLEHETDFAGEYGRRRAAEPSPRSNVAFEQDLGNSGPELAGRDFAMLVLGAEPATCATDLRAFSRSLAEPLLRANAGRWRL
jgi:hypothetical protein